MSGSGSPGRAGPADREGDAVLSTVLLNNRALRQGPEEDPDLALAKMLQAQEQAWMAMAGGGGALENLPLAGGSSGGEPAVTARDSEPTDGREDEEQLTDEEMARRLQEDEEREFQARLLALAGMAPAAAGGGGGGAAAAGDGEAGGDAGEGAGEEAEYLTEDEVDPDELTYEELTALGEAVGTVSRGIAQADIDALPTAQYYEVAGTAGAGAAEAEEQCPICRVEYEPEDSVRVLPLCRHYYHPECIAEWLKRNKVCCICNKEVLAEGKKEAGAAGGGASRPGAAAPGSSGGGAVLGERRH